MCIGMANGVKTPQEKIKAIYPHIVVGGDIDKPCYTIHWYDIEQKTMICGFGSYKLELVRKWLEEEFEVVERDIDNLIKSQETEIEKLRNNCAKFNSLVERAFALCDDKDKQLETLFEVIERWKKICKKERFLAYREFARELKLSSFLLTHKKINRILKRMVDEQK